MMDTGEDTDCIDICESVLQFRLHPWPSWH